MNVERGIRGRRVAVTGGCGFIGSHLVGRLLDEGAKEVVVVDSLRYGARENLRAGDARLRVVEHTLGREPTARLQPELAECDYLLHLAAEKHNQSKDSPRQVIDANLLGTFELFELAREVGVKRALFTSSLYAYGRMRGADMHEGDVPQPETIYGISKLVGEHLLRFAARDQGLRVASIRYFFIYGPRQFAGLGYKSVIMKNFERIARGEAPVIHGDGQQVLDYLYVNDAVEATLRALITDDCPPVLNVGSGTGVSINELTEVMLDVAGSKSNPVHGPPDWTEGTRRVADISKTRDCLEWTPETPLKTGLARTWAWMQQNA